ncbi:MAG: polyprenyl synthetase family protein, partial [Chitinophagia bacterium]|nr:polyprenyl synthetase family protein [Chitinophagia bacterium]
MNRTGMELVHKVIGKELQLFEKKFSENVVTENPLLDRIMKFIIAQKRKQMRPMYVFLSAAITGNITEATYRAAGLIELMHTASLIHDDVVDNAMMRRN